MGFNKRYVDSIRSIAALKKNDLRSLYGKSDMLLFEDNLSSKIFELYVKGKNDQEILKIINQKNTKNEMH